MEIGYAYGSYDVLRAEDLRELDGKIQVSKADGKEFFALGVYEEQFAKIQGGSLPLKSLEDRMKIAKQLRGIDFVFPISTFNKDEIRENILKALKEFLKEKENKEKNIVEKDYKIGYVPGTYDLFHAGHLENLLIASEQCDFIIAGVKADEVVKKQKNKVPIMNSEERVEILRHLKCVNDVYTFYVRDFNVVNQWIESKYGQKTDVVFCGEDLKKDYGNIKDINIIFTNRDEQKMKTRSTTHYRSLYLNINPEIEKATSPDLDKKVIRIRREREEERKNDIENNIEER